MFIIYFWLVKEELEVREALEREWEEEEEDDDDDDDDDDDFDEDDDEDDETGEEEDDDDDEAYNSGAEAAKDDLELQRRAEITRRVSFGNLHPPKETKQIIFQHSQTQSEPCDNHEQGYPSHPGDILSLVPLEPRSILKLPENFDPAAFVRPEPDPVPAREPGAPFINPISTLVVEKKAVAPEPAPSEPEKRVSKFKTMRMNK